ncbi:hypothetical protein LV457_10360 [Mycobacterium sp. MYCO198283]|uniref:Rv0361 family membrane protein n=1 Tax=Mycobacterium sp. MYCO198283 TaxID=2883505 RepID=UPI001E62DEF7|nr:hypothetical protein [Mycobacterium sp. MYCO198283]MCG5432689.1 hypothetical protein [Mycobacterium sp. MYCO198283]
MAGENSPDPEPTAVPPAYDDHAPQPGQPAFDAGGAEYPGVLPPPVEYPQRPRRRWPAVAIATVAALAVVGAAAFFAVVDRRGDGGGERLTPDNARAAIQHYLDALQDADIDAITRNMLCGIYDEAKDRRADEQLAKLSSDAYRKQFESARVVSVDKIVYSSPRTGQVLFTMAVVPFDGADEEEVQAVAQLLSQDGEVLVCSYLLRPAGQF